MKRKTLALFVAAIMILGTAAPSFAATETRNISASYSGITIYIDLEPVTLKDASGNVIEPFISGGTTYLPVRGIAEALGLEVAWDGETKSVRIDEPTAEAPDESKTDADAGGEDATEDAAEDAKTEDAATSSEETGDADTAETYEPFIGTKTLAVTYNDISIYIKGAKISPKDVSGNATEPFISGGTTYLPVRAVAEALGLTVSDGAAKSVYVGEQPEKTASAYDRYAAAAAALEEPGSSYAADLSGDMSIVIDGKPTDTKTSGSLKQINHSAADIELALDMTVNVAGQDIETKTYYKDGFIYTEAAGEKIKMATPIDQALAQAGNIEILEGTIKAQSADGNTLSFTLDGDKLMSAAESALGGLESLTSDADGVKIGDVDCTAVLDDAGALKSIAMAYPITLTAADGTISIEYDLTIAYTQIGGVSITAPADLSTYKELDLSAQ